MGDRVSLFYLEILRLQVWCPILLQFLKALVVCA